MNYTYHKYKEYLECPKRFKFHEEKVKPPIKDNKYFALYGNAIGKFFEYYCNEWLPSEETLETREQIEAKLRPIWYLETTRNYVDWNAPFARKGSDELFEDLVNDVLENLAHFSLFPECRAEVPLKLTLKSGDKVRGRIDMVRETSEGIEILDGKGTDKVGKNISEEQLFTYVILYHYVYRVWPVRVGFLYYKLRLIEYIPFTAEDIEKYKKKFFTVMISAKNDKEYKATPSSKACIYCLYKSECHEHLAHKKSRTRKSKITSEHNGSVQTLSL